MLVIILTGEQQQNQEWGLVDRKLHVVQAPPPPPPCNFIAGRPKFGFFVILDGGAVIYRYFCYI